MPADHVVTRALPGSVETNQGVPPVVGSTLKDAATLAGARGFLLGKGVNGPPTPITFPGAPRTLATGVNDRGQITGAHEPEHTTPSPQPAGTPSTRRMP
jgi:hypothetical protein